MLPYSTSPVDFTVALEMAFLQPSTFLRTWLTQSAAAAALGNVATIVSSPNSVGTLASGTTYVCALLDVDLAFLRSILPSQPRALRGGARRRC